MRRRGDEESEEGKNNVWSPAAIELVKVTTHVQQAQSHTSNFSSWSPAAMELVTATENAVSEIELEAIQTDHQSAHPAGHESSQPSMITSPPQGRLSNLKYFHYIERGSLAETVGVPVWWFAILLDFLGACSLFIQLLAVPETFSACGGSILSILLYAQYGSELSSKLTWDAVSIILVFPITNGIKDAFIRREGAISQLAEFRSFMSNIFLAHACWDWPGTSGFCGKGEDGIAKENGGTGLKGRGLVALPAEHLAHVRVLLHAILDSVQELLLVPRRGRMRHVHMPCGKEELQQVMRAEYHGRQHVIQLIQRLHRATESLKAAGLPGPEAQRLNSYICSLTTIFEKLFAYKTYRTPVALSAIAYVATQFLPAFYAPYFLHISRGEGGERNLAFACVFACLLACLLVALQHLKAILENPFRQQSKWIGFTGRGEGGEGEWGGGGGSEWGKTDNVNVEEEMRLCRQALEIAEQDLENAWFRELEIRAPPEVDDVEVS